MKKTLVTGSVAGALAVLLAAGGYMATATAQPAVNRDVPIAGAPVSFADIVQRVAPATEPVTRVFFIDVTIGSRS